MKARGLTKDEQKMVDRINEEVEKAAFDRKANRAAQEADGTIPKRLSGTRRTIVMAAPEHHGAQPWTRRGRGKPRFP